MIRAGVGLADAEAGETAAAEAVEAAMAHGGLGQVYAALVFTSFHYEGQYQQIVDTVAERTGCSQVVGCSTIGVIGPGREREWEPGIVVLLLQSDTMQFRARLVRGEEGILTPAQLGDSVADAISDFALEGDARGRMLLLFSDPLVFHPPRLLSRLVARCPMPVLGGAASRDSRVVPARQWGPVAETGKVQAVTGAAAVLVVSGRYECLTTVAQSCTPLGDPFIVTEVGDDGVASNLVRRIAGRPAAEVLREVIAGVSPDRRAQLLQGVFLGIVLDESKTELGLGDYVVRNMTGVDPESGALGVGDRVRVGQTVQFQVRDPDAARTDLDRRLSELRAQLGGTVPAFGLYLNCMGRGKALFSRPDYEVAEIAATFGALPLAGLFTNSEFVPLAGRNVMHNYSGVLALFCEGSRTAPGE